MSWMGFGLSGLLVSDNIRCLFMPARVDWFMPRMGFGLIGELAHHDTHKIIYVAPFDGCMASVGGW